MPKAIEMLRAPSGAESYSTDARILELSPLDDIYITMKLVVDIGLTFEGSIDLFRFQQAISASLVQFWPCAGRFRKSSQGKWSIVGNNAGVAFCAETVGETALPPPELPLNVKYFHRVPDPAHHPIEQDDAFPLLAVKVTLLGDQGFVVGVSVAHVLADLRSTYELIRAWARLYSDASNPLLQPIHDRRAVYEKLRGYHHDPSYEQRRRSAADQLVAEQPRQPVSGILSRIEAYVRQMLHSRPMSVVCFVVSDSELEQQKQSILAAAQEEGGLNEKVSFLSRNDVLNAKLLSLIERATCQQQLYSKVCLVLQMRQLLQVEGYFGNGVHQEGFPLPRVDVAPKLRIFTDVMNRASYLSWLANRGLQIPAPIPRSCIYLNSWAKGFELDPLALGGSACVDVGQLGSCGSADPQGGFWAQRAAAFHRLQSCYSVATVHRNRTQKVSVLMPSWAAFKAAEILRREGRRTVGVWTPPPRQSDEVGSQRRAVVVAFKFISACGLLLALGAASHGRLRARPVQT